jgi:hypothetical protein
VYKPLKIHREITKSPYLDPTIVHPSVTYPFWGVFLFTSEKIIRKTKKIPEKKFGDVFSTYRGS